MIMHAGQTREHIRVNLAEWISRSHALTPSQAMLMPHGACMAIDFSLEKLSGFGDLLQHCTGLVRLEATGNDLTSLAGRAHHASAEIQPWAVCFIWPCLSCPNLSGPADHCITTALALCCTCPVLLSTALQCPVLPCLCPALVLPLPCPASALPPSCLSSALPCLCPALPLPCPTSVLT